MKTLTWFGLGAVAVTAACFAGAEDITKINSPISIDANQEAGDIADVNGAVHIGDHCTVKDVSSVNGGIDIGSASRTREVKTVNGSVWLGANARVSGDAATVNGKVTLERAADVTGSLTNVNGNIVLTAAHVGDGITTVWGDIEIGKDSRVERGILVKKPRNSWSSDKRPPIIVIGPGATVTGTLKFEHEVKLYVSDKATIGAVEGAKATVYSGDRP
jgi:hypothetical protein